MSDGQNMRILHIITNTELGGAQRVCIDLANSAMKEGFKVAVASAQGGYLWESLPEGILQYPIPTLVKPINPIKDIRAYTSIKKIIQKFEPAIIHLHSSKVGILGRLASIGSKAKIIYTIHGFDSIRLQHRKFLPLERIFQKLTDYIVPVSKYDYENLINEKITKNLITIPNGVVKPKEKKYLPNNERFKDKKIILTIARISPPKRLDIFISVAGQFDPNKYLFIWVGGSTHKTLDELHTEYKIPENVIITGHLTDANFYLHICDIFVLFSDYEGLPMTILEAMAQSKPIIASNVGGISELVTKENGYLIQTEKEAVNAIKKTIDNPELLESMGKASYTLWEKNFSLESMWKKYKTVYES